MGSPKREDLVSTALRLFSAHGVHAVGIDRVLQESGVAKATLYKHFRSKDDLVLAAQHRLDEAGRCELARFVEAASDDPRERFAAVADAVAGAAHNGCFFVLTAQEYPDPQHPVHVAASEHKRLMRAWLADLARAAGADEPEEVAGRAQLVLDGLYCAGALGAEDLERARATARRALVDLVG
jgi:AcrR family transcriptional regulator